MSIHFLKQRYFRKSDVYDGLRLRSFTNSHDNCLFQSSSLLLKDLTKCTARAIALEIYAANWRLQFHE
ncbi:MAG: hypothetical protein RMZ43_012160 [Nostoc sp. CmiVER01]|uniref:hypothetical protein n=1 Tax=Nostoc sp. CmiVER01 TaxID=3075384 RepID=UPI002AD51F96|nr:hypothetical protein [Nostoc sp. CmiVER01]MDZ8121542.1 hypothetical protein [Nostoc sp. CmiVER01]